MGMAWVNEEEIERKEKLHRERFAYLSEYTDKLEDVIQGFLTTNIQIAYDMGTQQHMVSLVFSDTVLAEGRTDQIVRRVIDGLDLKLQHYINTQKAKMEKPDGGT